MVRWGTHSKTVCAVFKAVCRPHAGCTRICPNERMRLELYAVIVNTNEWSTRLSPPIIIWQRPPTVLAQPESCSMSLRLRCDGTSPWWRRLPRAPLSAALTCSARVRCHAHVPACIDELPGVIGRVHALVRAQRDAARVVVCRLASRSGHDRGCFVLGMTVGRADQVVGNQAMPVVQEGVAHVAHLADRFALAVQPRIGAGAGFVGPPRRLRDLRSYCRTVVTIHRSGRPRQAPAFSAGLSVHQRVRKPTGPASGIGFERCWSGLRGSLQRVRACGT